MNGSRKLSVHRERNQLLYNTQKSISDGFWTWRNSSYMTNLPLDKNHKLWTNISLRNLSECLQKNQSKQKHKRTHLGKGYSTK